MNIAMFTNVYKPFVGGVPVSIERLAKALKNKGHNIYIFAPEYPEKVLDDENIIRCRVIAFYSSDKFDIPVADILSRDMKKQFMSLDIDVVHVHHPIWMGKRGCHLARMAGVPVVFTYHTKYEEYLHIFMPRFLKANLETTKFKTIKLISKGKKRKRKKRITNYVKYTVVPRHIKRFMKKCDGVIFPTESMRIQTKASGIRTYVLPTGLESSSYVINTKRAGEIRGSLIENKKYLFISVSRITKEKNIEFMIEALPTLKEMLGDNFVLLLVGSGDLTEKLKQKAEELGVSNNVKFSGNISNDRLSDYYAACDLFLFASKSETQGIVLLEAMAQGVPVVAINSTGVRDFVENGKNGYLANDDIICWCDAVKMAVGDKTLKTGALTISKKYTCEKMAERVIEIYHDVMAKNKEKKEEYLHG